MSWGLFLPNLLNLSEKTNTCNIIPIKNLHYMYITLINMYIVLITQLLRACILINLINRILLAKKLGNINKKFIRVKVNNNNN